MTEFTFSAGGIVARIRGSQRFRDGAVRASVDFLRGNQHIFSHRTVWTDSVERGAVVEKLTKETGLPPESLAADLLAMESLLATAVDTAPTPSDSGNAAWPEAPGEEAFAGLAGRIVRAAGPYTEADPIAILMNVLVAFGNAVGNGPHFMVGATRHGTNLFAVLVGDTSKARKGDSWSPVKWLFRRADIDWAADRVKSGLSTGEGLIWTVRDQIEKTEPTREKGKVTGYQAVVVDPGIDDKRLLIHEPELARALQAMARAGNTLSPVIREAWDRGNLDTLTKNSPARATEAHISLIGHITQEELRRSLTDVEVANGLANRMLWVLVRRSRLLPEPPVFGTPEHQAIAMEIQQAIASGKGVGRITRDSEARQLWQDVYEDLSKARPGLAGATVARAEAQVTRLAAVYALLDGSDVVQLSHLSSALELWGYADRSTACIWGERLGDTIADTIAVALRTNRVLSRSDISALFDRHESSSRIASALRALMDAGRIRKYTDPTDGRPVEYWEWTA